MTQLDTRSSECGWQPLIDWLAEHGLDASDVRSIDLDDQTLVGEVVVYKRRAGKKYVVGHGADEHIATTTRKVQFRTPPPRLEVFAP